MNAIEMLSSHAWVERLGWTLIHFVWEGAAIAILYEAVRRVLAREAKPNKRYLLACAALGAMVAAPLVTWEVIGPPDLGPLGSYRVAPIPPRTAAGSGTGGPAASTALPGSIGMAIRGRPVSRLLVAVVIIWIAGAMIFWARLLGGWVLTARMRSMLVRRAPPEWEQKLASLGARIGLSRPVSLLVSALVQAPTVAGWLRPVVLVPVGAIGGVPAEHLEALLLHELAHILRLDYVINILQGVAEALLFYHPAVWWVSGHIRAERELCCDDIAVAASGDALMYARALAEMEAGRRMYFNAALGANGGSLAGRIARLLGQARPGRNGLGPAVFTVTILLSAAAYGLFGQPEAHPAFEVASIKRTPPALSNGPQSPMGGGVKPGGRLEMAQMTLAMLIRFAYAPHDSPHSMPLLAAQVAAPGGWMQTEAYNIDAKAAPNTDAKLMWLMLQTLLTDRFKLALHRETRQLTVYDLVAVKSGLKLRPAKPAECVSFPPGTPPHYVQGKVDCGYVSGPFGVNAAGPLRIQGRKVHVADLIRGLSSILDVPVLDKTGYTGDFDVSLTFTPDEMLRGYQLTPGSPAFRTDPDLPNIAAALEEQLGLKLVGAKGPVEVLVVDHAERPSPN